MRKPLVSVLTVCAAASALSACNFLKDTASEATSHTIMISQVLTTPDESIAGRVVKGKVLATVFLGDRDPASTSAPTGVAGAQVHLEFDGKSVTLADKGGGNYSATNMDSADLVYTQGSTYRFVVVNSGSTFAESVQAPEREQIKEFHQGLLDPNYDAGFNPDLDAGAYLYPDGGLAADLPGFIYVTPGQSLTLTRPDNAGERNIALTAVVPLDDQTHEPGQPNFTSPDTSPLSLLGLLVNPGPYKQPTISVDGTKAWPSCSPQDHVVTVTSVKKGSAEGNNLAIGASLVFAGSADAAPVRCKTP